MGGGRELILHWDVGPLDDTATGKVAVAEWFGDWFRRFGPDYRFDVEEAHDAGDRVLVVATHGHGRRSG